MKHSEKFPFSKNANFKLCQQTAALKNSLFLLFAFKKKRIFLFCIFIKILYVKFFEIISIFSDMTGNRKRSRKSKEIANRTSALKIKNEEGPGLILIFNIHHATLDTYNLNTKKYTSNDLELSSKFLIYRFYLFE